MRQCSDVCLEHNVACPAKECRLWIDYPKDNNCTLIAIYKNDYKPMKLREIGERLHVTAARIKQIESECYKKINSNKDMLTILN